MVLVCRELRQVLRDDGTFWLNMGDTYSSTGGKAGGSIFESGRTDGRPDDGGRERWAKGHQYNLPTESGLPSGNLCGVPWRLALALQADGWVLRSDIPWVKASSMPEPVRNRPCKSLEYVFLLTRKGSGYYYDCDAVRKPSVGRNHHDLTGPARRGLPGQADHTGTREKETPAVGRNFRNADLWFESVNSPHGLTGVGDELVGLDVTSEAYSGAHFATFSKKLIQPLILAGTSARGCCAKCRAPWQRVVERVGGPPKGSHRNREDFHQTQYNAGAHPSGENTGGALSSVYAKYGYPENKTTGWQPTCTCHGRFEPRKVTKLVAITGIGEHEKKCKTVNSIEGSTQRTPLGYKETEIEGLEYVSDLPLDEHPVQPCVVFDPFIGSGTAAVVAIEHGCHCWGIDLSEVYLMKNAIPRIEGFLLAKPASARLVPSR